MDKKELLNMRQTKEATKQKNSTKSYNEKISIDNNENVLNLINYWITSADNKIEIAMAIYSVIFSIFGYFGFDKISEYKKINSCAFWPIFIALIVSVIIFAISIFFYVSALVPRFTGFEKKDYSIFYEEIKLFKDKNEYIESVMNSDQINYNEELMSEAYFNSKICSKKMHKFKAGIILSLIAIILEIFLLTLTLILIAAH